MNTVIWIAQLALAAIFLVSGTFKLFAFAPMVQAVQGRSAAPITMMPIQSKLIGILEVALAFGVLMPDVFTPDALIPEYLIIRFSAAGLALLMIGAGIYHVRRKQPVIVGRTPSF
jgi:hypothetical protein